MSLAPAAPEPAGIDFHDILFALFRHKWKLIACSFLGIGGAAGFYLLGPKSFQSETLLLVKYVLDRSAIDPVESQSDTTGRFGDPLIGAEAAIISSWDLARAVADSVGPDRILAGLPGEHTPAAAAAVVLAGLEVKTVKGSNVVTVDFHNKNPALPQPVLQELVKRYFDKHLEVHRSTQAFDFVSQQKDLVKARLNDLDAKIKTLKDQAGITSLVEGSAGLEAQIAHIRQDALTAQAERDEQDARVTFLLKSLGGAAQSPPVENSPKSDSASLAIPPATLQEYQALVERLDGERKVEAAALTRYTEESTEVKTVRARISPLEASRLKLESQYPALAGSAAKTSPQNRQFDVLSEQAHLAATEARLATLNRQLTELEASAAKINAVAAQLQDLESQREVEQKNYVEFQSKLDKSRIDEALDPSKIPNISVLQQPSPAGPLAGKTLKIAGGIAAGGVGLGVALALGLGLFLDRSVKRPRELETRLHLPLWGCVPRVVQPSRPRLNGHLANSGALAPKSAGKVSAWQAGHFIRPFAEAVRNRLILGFELKKVGHKPKLVGVTSLSGGAGTSTLAGGLAASLSETGEGKVLLVDMNAHNPELRPFFEGASSASLLDALRPEGEMPCAGENLYLATGQSKEEGAITIAPRRFYDLMPVLRASGFDYIIFDLPPLDQSGATLAVSGFMDKVLFMVEAEKTNRDSLKRACDDLRAANADLATVLNKVDDSMPQWAQG